MSIQKLNQIKYEVLHHVQIFDNFTSETIGVSPIFKYPKLRQ